MLIQSMFYISQGRSRGRNVIVFHKKRRKTHHGSWERKCEAFAEHTAHERVSLDGRLDLILRRWILVSFMDVIVAIEQAFMHITFVFMWIYQLAVPKPYDRMIAIVQLQIVSCHSRVGQNTLDNQCYFSESGLRRELSCFVRRCGLKNTENDCKCEDKLKKCWWKCLKKKKW